MDTSPVDLEARLQTRYHTLVEQHSPPSSTLTSGLHALPDGGKAFAATQRHALLRPCENDVARLIPSAASAYASENSRARARVRLRSSCGWLRQLLSRLHFADLPLWGQVCEKASLTAHLPNGVVAHRRHKAVPKSQSIQQMTV